MFWVCTVGAPKSSPQVGKYVTSLTSTGSNERKAMQILGTVSISNNTSLHGGTITAI